MDYAYTSLSDEALASSGSAPGMLPERRPITTIEGEHTHPNTIQSLTRDGGVRLQKDYDMAPDEHAVIHCSASETSSAESIESSYLVT